MRCVMGAMGWSQRNPLLLQHDVLAQMAGIMILSHPRPRPLRGIQPNTLPPDVFRPHPGGRTVRKQRNFQKAYRGELPPQHSADICHCGSQQPPPVQPSKDLLAPLPTAMHLRPGRPPHWTAYSLSPSHSSTNVGITLKTAANTREMSPNFSTWVSSFFADQGDTAKAALTHAFVPLPYGRRSIFCQSPLSSLHQRTSLRTLTVHIRGTHPR